VLLGVMIDRICRAAADQDVSDKGRRFDMRFLKPMTKRAR